MLSRIAVYYGRLLDSSWGGGRGVSIIYNCEKLKRFFIETESFKEIVLPSLFIVNLY